MGWVICGGLCTAAHGPSVGAWRVGVVEEVRG